MFGKDFNKIIKKLPVLFFLSLVFIVYYWFSMRGRILRNFYQVKLYNFWDALTMQRTDGALVRLITPVYETERLADADDRLLDFLREARPMLEEYIPGKELVERS